MNPKLLLLILIAAILVSTSQMSFIDIRLEAMIAECDEYNMDREMWPGESICDPTYFADLESLTPTQQSIKDFSVTYWVWMGVFWVSLGVVGGVVYRLVLRRKG